MIVDLDPVLELVDVGWIVWERVEGDPGDRSIRGGTVIEIRDDPLADTRIFVIVDSFHGRTRFIDLAVHEIDPALTQLPNNAVIRSHIRRMDRETGTAKGAIDPWQYRVKQASMRLMEVVA